MNGPFTLIDVAPGCWRSSDIDEDGMPLSLRFHDDISVSPLDAIYTARVTRVDSTLDMAFLDMGDGIEGCLNFRRARLLVKGQVRSISDCVQEGQMLNVQVVSEPAAGDNKTLVVTPRPRLMGRYVVAETGTQRISVSKDIEAKPAKTIQAALGAADIQCVLIVRSRAGLVSVESVLAEAKALSSAITATPEKPGLVYGWSIGEKALLTVPDTDTPVCTENGSDLAALKTVAQRLWPDLLPRLSLYKTAGTESAFEELGVEEAIEEALADKISLPSGGWISITPTPALTAIDVNMGSALQGMSAAEAKLTVNMEATMALAYHMRFQDLAGLIVVDYIDMTGKGHTQALMQLIERVMREDSVPVQHTGISMFGLVEFTRKRSGLSLRDRYLMPARMRERPSASAISLMQKAVRTGRRETTHGPLVIAAPDAVINWLNTRPSLMEDISRQAQRALVLETASAADVYIRARTA
ncbi:ribonuclease E/G [Kordiimonas pumila]|uniref:Ribonuclease E/G n=1 Tax=Kordiimonas pumila TaxID=2161677 RepID=A0ABV7D166_9PROT|nr:ribonuclease E/G [Kordiimonas pumila]